MTSSASAAVAEMGGHVAKSWAMAFSRYSAIRSRMKMTPSARPRRRC